VVSISGWKSEDTKNPKDDGFVNAHENDDQQGTTPATTAMNDARDTGEVYHVPYSRWFTSD